MLDEGRRHLYAAQYNQFTHLFPVNPLPCVVEETDTVPKSYVAECRTRRDPAAGSHQVCDCGMIRILWPRL